MLALVIFEVPGVPDTFAAAHDRAVLQNDLRDAVEAFGTEGLNRCGDPILRGDLHWNEGAVAFTMGEHLKDVRRVLPWKAIDGQHDGPVVMLSPLGGEPFPKPWRARIELIGRRGDWGLYRITPATEARPPPCRV